MFKFNEFYTLSRIEHDLIAKGYFNAATVEYALRLKIDKTLAKSVLNGVIAIIGPRLLN